MQQWKSTEFCDTDSDLFSFSFQFEIITWFVNICITYQQMLVFNYYSNINHNVKLVGLFKKKDDLYTSTGIE